MMRVVFNIFKSLFSMFFRPLKRLWCRRLKTSEMDPGILTVVTHSTAVDMPQSFEGGAEAEMEMESWDVWDTSQSQPGQGNISNSAYCQHASRGGQLANQEMRGRKPEQELEPEPDYFLDMIPDFKRPAKILLKKKDNGGINSSAINTRLSVMDVAPTAGSELQTWREEESEWGAEVNEDLSWEAEEALREKRRLERQNRTMEHQRKKLERDSMRGMKKDAHLAVKIS
ncbi:hypothetical protein ACOMHN_063002 [Nucella lapillus]